MGCVASTPAFNLQRLNQILTSEQRGDVQVAFNNGKLVLFCDWDGTMAEAGHGVSRGLKAILSALRDKQVPVYIVTAQSDRYMHFLSSQLVLGIVFECEAGMVTPGNVQRFREFPDLTAKYEEIESVVGEANVNRKNLGFAVDLRHMDDLAKDAAVAKVQFMADRDGMRAVESTGYIDHTDSTLSKGNGVRRIKQDHQDCYCVGMGDTPETDGPMLAECDLGLIVGTDYSDATRLNDIDDVHCFLSWVATRAMQ